MRPRIVVGVTGATGAAYGVSLLARLRQLDVETHLVVSPAGVLNAHQTFFIGPNEFGFDRGVDILTMTVLGGINGLTGPVLGGVILTILPEALRAFGDFRLVVNGVILVLIVLFLPKGIWDPARFRQWFGRKGAAA